MTPSQFRKKERSEARESLTAAKEELELIGDARTCKMIDG